MKHKTKEILAAFQRKAMVPVVGMTTALMMSVSAFAAEGDTATATIDPALFDSLVTGVVGNISAVLPKVLVVIALLLGLGAVIALFKKHARPS